MAKGEASTRSSKAERPLVAFFESIERNGNDTSRFSLKDATRLVREDRDGGH